MYPSTKEEGWTNAGLANYLLLWLSMMIFNVSRSTAFSFLYTWAISVFEHDFQLKVPLWIWVHSVFAAGLGDPTIRLSSPPCGNDRVIGLEFLTYGSLSLLRPDRVCYPSWCREIYVKGGPMPVVLTLFTLNGHLTITTDVLCRCATANSK